MAHAVQRRRRAGRPDGAERRTPLSPVGGWKGEAFRVGVDDMNNWSWRARCFAGDTDAGSSVALRACVTRDGGVIEGEKQLNIPLRVLQATAGAVIDGFAKAFDRFTIYHHEGRSHDRFE
jgi:hypothetical protein